MNSKDTNQSRVRYKRTLASFGAFVVAMMGVSTGVGNYFVNYALVPQQGGNERQVDVGLQTSQEMERIQAHRQQHIVQRDKWLKSVARIQQPVQIQSNDGLTLSGHLFEQLEATNQWIIIVHGYQSTEEEGLLIAPHFYEKGYNILSIQQRAHQQSEGQFITMGVKEKEDLLSWTRWLVDYDPASEIIWHGTSMGAATVMMAAPDAPTQVYGIIEDCGYTTAWDIFSSELQARFKLPSFPILNLSNMVAKVRADVDFKKASAIDGVRRTAIPILFIHGAADDFVPEWMARELYNAKTNGMKELYIVPQAGHAEAKFKDGSQYYDRIDQFITKARKEY